MHTCSKKSRADQKSVTAIIQARMNSTRLPGKSVKFLSDKPVLAHIIERAFLIDNVDNVIVATGNPAENGEIVDLSQRMGAKVYTGSDHNVLERYYKASQMCSSDFIMRITGDNPFTDVDYASMAVENAIQTDADLSSISGIPLGTAIEMIKTSALEKAYTDASEHHHFEHVTPYIKEHPESFRIVRKPVHIYNMIPDLRLTIDTAEDFDLASRLYSALYRGKPFSLHHILNYLKLNCSLLSINSGISQRPMTHFETSNVIHSVNSI